MLRALRKIVKFTSHAAMAALLTGVAAWLVVMRTDVASESTRHWFTESANSLATFFVPAHTAIGLPRDIENLTPGSQALYFFNLGNIQLANNKIVKAQSYYRKAVAVGEEIAAPASMQAARRLQLLGHTCGSGEKTEITLAAGSLTTTEIRQALKAGGYHTGAPDDELGSLTELAVIAFQEDIGAESVTGTLLDSQAVTLICIAAQIHQDPQSQVVLARMYAEGFGVARNINLAHYWLSKALTRGDAKAAFHLAMLHGMKLPNPEQPTQPAIPTRVAFGATKKHCALAYENHLHLADKYLSLAADWGHERAHDLQVRYGNMTRADRWNGINRVFTFGLTGKLATLPQTC